ncbi:MAG: GNVR domain-containing protein [Anaerolineaceae bacterium]
MELETYLAILGRRKWLALSLFCILMIIIVVVSLMIPPRYSATAIMRVVTPKNGGLSYVDYNSFYATLLMNTYVHLLTSSAVENELKTTLQLQEIPKLKITALAESELITITATDRDPWLSANVANTLADILVTHNDEYVKVINDTADTEFVSRIASLEDNLNQSRDAYEALLIPYNQTTTRIDTLNNQIDYNQRLLITLKDRYELSAMSAGNDPAQVETLGKQVSDLEDTISKQSAEVEKLKSQASEDKLLVDAANGKVQVAQEEYTNMLMQWDQVKALQTMQGVNQLVIADRAEAESEPSSPNYYLVIALGLFVSAFLSILVAFVVDNLDDRLHSVEQVEALTQSRSLAYLPFPDSRRKNYEAEKESYLKKINQLMHNLKRILADRSIESLTITQVGNTSRVSNIITVLAAAFAKSGTKTVLLDANFGSPVIHEILQLSSAENGLAQVLNEEISLDEAIIGSSVNNLFVIPAGQEADSKAFLLGCDKMKEVINRLRRRFDLVLINAAPLFIDTDADEMLCYAGGVVLMIEKKKTLGRQVNDAIQLINNLEVPLLGVVVNDFDRDGDQPPLLKIIRVSETEQ